MTTEHKPHSSDFEIVRDALVRDGAALYAEAKMLGVAPVKAPWAIQAFERIEDELRRIADDPARALSLRERGIV